MLKTERWAFTKDELENPAACRRDDDWVAWPEDVPGGVCVDRTGKSTGDYFDGSGRVSDEDAESAAGEDDIFRLDEDSGQAVEPQAKWLDVVAKEDGGFFAFANDKPRDMVQISLTHKQARLLNALLIDLDGQLQYRVSKTNAVDLEYTGRVWRKIALAVAESVGQADTILTAANPESSVHIRRLLAVVRRQS